MITNKIYILSVFAIEIMLLKKESELSHKQYQSMHRSMKEFSNEQCNAIPGIKTA